MALDKRVKSFAFKAREKLRNGLSIRYLTDLPVVLIQLDVVDRATDVYICM